ncbi:zwei Ig domain protein zig-8-like [Limulus polyphemus]|uniref:Zwei Ig domain protein zig-8-like n=1 Tax=Limulus polyphemus TaxID=6850 RepID=A0ABM1SH70_LIMPO|nr:zwei Ig domain protein zig-8-like [Limulus polyphemus]
MKVNSLAGTVKLSLLSVIYLCLSLSILGRPSLTSEALNEKIISEKRGHDDINQDESDGLKTFNSTSTESESGDFNHPTFGEDIPKNVTTQLGKMVFLHCVVHNIGDKTVSWIRRKDFHLLSVGHVTYTAEKRFKVVYVEDSNDWILQMASVQPGDAGSYECQVNTHPMISYFVYLTVLIPEAAIAGAPDLHFESGSTINLTCIITRSPSPPIYVFWYHGDTVINYDPSRGHTTLQKINEDTALSSLNIINAKTSDSGNYTCCPSNADATSISVHVLNGEQLAAMQHDAETSSSSSDCYCTLLLVVISWVSITLLIRPC